jgi:hypothetical protein
MENTKHHDGDYCRWNIGGWNKINCQLPVVLKTSRVEVMSNPTWQCLRHPYFLHHQASAEISRQHRMSTESSLCQQQIQHGLAKRLAIP